MAITTWAATTGDWDDSKFSRAWDGPNIVPAVGSLSLSTTAVSLTTGYYISPEKGDITLIQSYEWNQLTTTWDTTLGTWASGPVPLITVGVVITPANADLSLATYAPAAGIIYTFQVAKGDLTTTGYAPAFGMSHFMSPDNGALTGLGSTTWDNYSGTWAASSDNWGVGTLSPTLGVTYTFPIDEGDLTVSGYKPVKVAKDPTHLASIIVT